MNTLRTMNFSEHRAAMNTIKNRPFPMYRVSYYGYDYNQEFAYYDSFVRAVKRYRFENEHGPADIVRTDDPIGSCLFMI